MTPEGFRTSDFDYHLPPELIAQEPLPDRSGSRLLAVLRNNKVERLPGTRTTAGAAELVDARFFDLPTIIPAGDLLVLNTTRVRHARLLGTRQSGAPAEILLIHPASDGDWVALGKPGSALRPGKRVTLAPDAAVETVGVLPDGNRLVRFIGLTADAAIRRYGRLPLPPYISRAPTELDESRYQTVYARLEGSVAAPTAGLHFTPWLLEHLAEAGVLVEGLDLQVGPGTFQPVEIEDPAAHEMHPERYEIPSALASRVAAVRTAGGCVWAVGTTVVRALESAARADRTVQPGAGETRLMITPGYNFRLVDRMLTNFHLPRSTLLMLVSAFAGHRLTMAAYQHAIEQRYRFYSYGDAMVII
ncbi:MAG TPA: tRNA preQ1(34) S-adenosylmethionine ribosyltransferase-isomerase QueA [Gemmatimonadales bacterium]|nr:tRNA preQ1(34) S-adenosylmethionine ribosyltransferase-isomerase QueA [Gemmatimonadales bacterium]